MAGLTTSVGRPSCANAQAWILTKPGGLNSSFLALSLNANCLLGNHQFHEKLGIGIGIRALNCQLGKSCRKRKSWGAFPNSALDKNFDKKQAFSCNSFWGWLCQKTCGVLCIFHVVVLRVSRLHANSSCCWMSNDTLHSMQIKATHRKNSRWWSSQCKDSKHLQGHQEQWHKRHHAPVFAFLVLWNNYTSTHWLQLTNGSLNTCEISWEVVRALASKGKDSKFSQMKWITKNIHILFHLEAGFASPSNQWWKIWIIQWSAEVNPDK